MLVPWRVSFRDVLTLSLSDQVVVSSIFHFYPWGNDPNWTIIFLKLVGSTTNLVSLTNEDLSRSLRNREEISALDLSVETMEPMNFRCVSDGRPQLKKKYPTNRIHGTNGIFLPTFWLIFENLW